MVLVPSLGILLFNTFKLFSMVSLAPFSSPPWGFFYLIVTFDSAFNRTQWFSSPLWGFFYLIKFDTSNVTDMRFSSPLWGFFYLINYAGSFNFKSSVLVPSLGILLFNVILTAFGRGS